MSVEHCNHDNNPLPSGLHENQGSKPGMTELSYSKFCHTLNSIFLSEILCVLSPSAACV